MCLRGSRSSSGHPFKGRVPASVDVVLVEGRIDKWSDSEFIQSEILQSMVKCELTILD